MASQKVLIVGGTGTISAACVARALEEGHEVTVLNRGGTHALRPLRDGVELVRGDVRSPESVRDAIGKREFDVVAQFVSFTADHIATDIDLFGGRTGQYIFISSASAYQKPPLRMPIIESTPLRNPFWQYSRDKIACEDVLVAAYRDRGFPATIVRPSHTYDHTKPPTDGGWTDVTRMRAGKPVIVHGDGTSQWTITHSKDFAVGFVGLFGRQETIGDSFHIAGDHAPTWNQIYGWLARAAGVEPALIHVASETIAAEYPDIGPSLLGDKSHSTIFDNSKIKSLVPEFATTIPYSVGAIETLAWYDAHPEEHRVDVELDAAFDRLAARYA